MSTQETKRRLNVIQVEGKDNKVVDCITCFSAQSKYGVDCQRKDCQNWISHSENHNCVILAAKEGPHTLQKIGKIYGLTRMRICQIEKTIFEKIRKNS